MQIPLIKKYVMKYNATFYICQNCSHLKNNEDLLFLINQ